MMGLCPQTFPLYSIQPKPVLILHLFLEPWRLDLCSVLVEDAGQVTQIFFPDTSPG
jgi:hypothetical protein